MYKRQEGYLYVDKTDIIWDMVNNGDQFVYLSRPRRFGKSVLVDTLQMYLEGRKELFDGLKIMDMEEDWTRHPVIRLDMSRGGASVEEIKSYLNNVFKSYEKDYHINISPEDTLSVRFDNIIKAAYNTSGQQVAIPCLLYTSPSPRD